MTAAATALRLIQPFPPRIASARGAYLIDEDGHRILDCWQGHHTNVLGHNPDVVTAAVVRGLEEGIGLQTGFTDRIQVETAELLCRQVGAERVRFTTSAPWRPCTPSCWRAPSPGVIW